MNRITLVVVALITIASFFVYYGCLSNDSNSPSESALGIASAPPVASTPPPDHPAKVKLCHVPPGHPENAHVIVISEKGLAAHLAHGDCYAPDDAMPGDPCECAYNPDPECQGETCGTFTSCNLPSLCLTPVCVTTAEGGGLCVEGATPCAGLPRCPGGTGDCPEGWICAVQTCCVDPVCIPPEAFCPDMATSPMAARIVLPPEYVGPRIAELGSITIQRPPR